MRQEIKELSENEFCVLVDEEYGYRKWFWFPRMSQQKLENWWSVLETVEYFLLEPSKLPGILFEVKNADEYNLFKDLALKSESYYIFLNDDEDSVLIKPNKKKLTHRGYKGFEHYIPENTKQVLLDFYTLDKVDQERCRKDTYCENCKQVNLGLIEPKLIKIENQEFIEGKCKVCGNRIIAEFTTFQVQKQNWRLQWILSVYGFANKNFDFQYLKWTHTPKSYTDFNEIIFHYWNDLGLLDGYNEYIELKYISNEEAIVAREFHELLISFLDRKYDHIHDPINDPEWFKVIQLAVILWKRIIVSSSSLEEKKLIANLETKFGKVI